MPFDIIDAVIGVLVGLLSCYIGWKGINVWLNDIPVESGFSKSVIKSGKTELLKIIAIIVAGIAMISGIWLILVVVSSGTVVINMPLGAMLILAGWRLLQRHASGYKQGFGIIAAALGSLLLVMAITAIFQIIFRILVWRSFFGF